MIRAMIFLMIFFVDRRNAPQFHAMRLAIGSRLDGCDERRFADAVLSLPPACGRPTGDETVAPDRDHVRW